MLYTVHKAIHINACQNLETNVSTILGVVKYFLTYWYLNEKELEHLEESKQTQGKQYQRHADSK